MKNALHRMVCLALCAAMLLAMVPGMTVSAAADTTEVNLWMGHANGANQYRTTTLEELATYEEAEEEPALLNEHTAGIPAADAVTKYGSTCYFETFGDLKDLVAEDDGSNIWAHYSGTDDLVISEDLTLPDNVELYIDNDVTVIINKGVTFTTHYAQGQDFTVNGTWNLNGLVNIYGKLTVNGNLNLLDGGLYLRNGGTITGLENVTKRYEDQNLSYYWDVRTVEDIEDAIAAAKSTTDGLPHGMNMRVEGTLTIDKSLTIPDNMMFHIWNLGTIEIPKGITFTTYSPSTILNCSLVVKGKFVNHGYIRFNSPSTLDVTGTYSGRGKLQVYNQNGETELSQIITGLDLDAFLVQEYENWGSHWWEILDPDYVTQLGTPKNLKWHKRVYWNEDGTVSLVDGVGCIAWTAVNPISTEEHPTFVITLYRNGEIYNQNWWGYNQEYFEQTKYCSADDLTFSLEDLPSGSYYFTVQARTDVSGYCNSDIAVSDTWEYTKPDTRVKRPSTLSWDGMIAQWNTVSGAERYQIQWLYSATKSGEPESVSWGWTYINWQEIWSWVIADNGPGYYYFKVRTLSENIEENRHSAWSELSPAYYYSGKAKPAAPTIKSDIDPATGKPQVYWDRVPGANKYRVYRSTSKDGTYESVYLFDTGSYSMGAWHRYSDGSAKAGTKYYYKVRAYSYTDVVSSFSNTVTRRCDLARPSVSISGNASTGKPVVSWKTVSGAEKYYIYRATSKTGTYTKVKTAVSARTFEDTTAKAGTNYYYKVKAIHANSDANSAYSKIINRMCDLKRPVVTISNSSAGYPYLKWSEISGAEKYFIYRATSKSGTYTRIGSTTSLKYVDKDVTEGKTYYYKVKAIHAKSGANSAYSAIDYIKAK